MSTPLKALIQERLRAKLVRQEVDDDVGFGVLGTSGFEARGELYSGLGDRRAGVGFSLHVPSALADTTPLIDPSEYLLPLSSPLHRAPPPPQQRRPYDKDDKERFAREDTRLSARKGRSRYVSDSMFDDPHSMIAPAPWRYADDALSNQVVDSPRCTQPREPASRRRRESKSPHHDYRAKEPPLPPTRARGSFERPCKDYMPYDDERYAAAFASPMIDYEDVERYGRRGRADDSGNPMYVSSNEHLELRRDRLSRQKSEYSWPEQVQERVAERTEAALTRRTASKPSNQTPETRSSVRPRDERRLAPLDIPPVAPSSGYPPSRLTRPYDDILSPGSRLAAKAFVEKRQKRSPQDTPRTRATQRWLQSKAAVVERLPSPSAYSGDLDGTVEL